MSNGNGSNGVDQQRIKDSVQGMVDAVAESAGESIEVLQDGVRKMGQVMAASQKTAINTAVLEVFAAQRIDLDDRIEQCSTPIVRALLEREAQEMDLHIVETMTDSGIPETAAWHALTSQYKHVPRLPDDLPTHARDGRRFKRVTSQK